MKIYEPNAEGEFVLSFYTPIEIARRMAILAQIDSTVNYVLDPSAGEGVLLAAAQEAGASNVRGIEVDASLVQATGARFLVEWADFLSLDLSLRPRPDRILMNPPFAKDEYILHVRRAFEFLAPEGRLVAITSPTWLSRDTEGRKSFAALVDARQYHTEHLPDDTFENKPLGVQLKAMMIALQKG